MWKILESLQGQASAQARWLCLDIVNPYSNFGYPNPESKQQKLFPVRPSQLGPNRESDSPRIGHVNSVHGSPSRGPQPNGGGRQRSGRHEATVQSQELHTLLRRRHSGQRPLRRRRHSPAATLAAELHHHSVGAIPAGARGDIPGQLRRGRPRRRPPA